MNSQHTPMSYIHTTGIYTGLFQPGIYVHDDMGNLVHFQMVDWLCNTGAIASTTNGYDQA